MDKLKTKKPSSSKIDSQQRTRTDQTRKDSQLQAASRQVLCGGGQAGDGIWCYANDNGPNLAMIRETEKLVNQKVKQIDSNIESEIVDMLNQQCHQLGLELDAQSVLNQNQKIEIAQLKRIIDQQNEKVSQSNKEADNQKNAKTSVGQQLETIRDLYNKTKRELGGSQQLLAQSQEENGQLRRQLDQMNEDYQKFKRSCQQELARFKEKNEELEEQNEELLTRLQVRGEIEKRVDEERNKHHNQQKLNNMTEAEKKLEKMGKLIEDNMTLTEKLAESETLRRRFMEKNQQQEKEMKYILESKIEVDKQIIQLKKRVNDLQIMKSTNQKILEDKINKLQDQLENQNKQQKVQTQKARFVPVVQNQDDDEDYEDIQAKPQLFGA